MRLHRRELLIAGAGALAAKATASTLACAADPSDGTKKSDTKQAPDASATANKDTKMDEHANHKGHKDAAKTGATEVDVALVNIVADCVAAGRVCLAHCLRLLGAGDTSMAECSKAVSDMLAICQATESLAASGSAHLESIAKVCIEGCTACAKACEPHVSHHAECKACKEACDATIEAMKAV